MREIKFRGKSLKNGKWVYGSLLLNGDNAVVVNESGESIKIDKKSIGQFVGAYDIYGKEIYEGDRLKLILRNGLSYATVKWSNILHSWFLEGLHEGVPMMSADEIGYRYEIIANIYDCAII